MIELIKNHFIVTGEIDLIHKPADEDWPEEIYFQRFPDGDTSQVFKTEKQARLALKNNKIKWS